MRVVGAAACVGAPVQDGDVGIVWLPLDGLFDGEFLHPQGDLQCRAHRSRLRRPRERIASSGHQAAHARHRSVLSPLQRPLHAYLQRTDEATLL